MQQSNLKPIELKKEKISRHIDTQKELFIQRNYLKPQAEFFERLNSVKSTKNSDPYDDKCSFPSTRPKKKVNKMINFFANQKQQAYFSNAQKLKKTQSEDTMDRIIGDQTNETTVKLRKSISSFNQDKYKLQISIPNKEARAGSHYHSQVDKPYIIDQYDSEKKPNKQEQQLKTIIRNQYTPSLVERSLGKKINLTRKVPFISEIDNYEYDQDYNQNQTNQDNRSNILPSRQRIFSTKIQQKNGLIQQHFQQPNRNHNEDSREIISNLQQKQQQSKIEPKHLVINSSLSNENNKSVAQVQSYQRNQYTTQSGPIEITDSPNDKNQDQIQITYKFPEISPILDELSPISVSPLKQQISDRIRAEGSKKSFMKSNDIYYQGKPKMIQNEKILDLLLLSTGELKHIFNKEGKEGKLIQPKIPKIVKYVQHNQRFPDDFFNAINK